MANICGIMHWGNVRAGLEMQRMSPWGAVKAVHIASEVWYYHSVLLLMESIVKRDYQAP